LDLFYCPYSHIACCSQRHQHATFCLQILDLLYRRILPACTALPSFMMNDQTPTNTITAAPTHDHHTSLEAAPLRGSQVSSLQTKNQMSIVDMDAARVCYVGIKDNKKPKMAKEPTPHNKQVRLRGKLWRLQWGYHPRT
jgi:hypothetical protein